LGLRRGNEQSDTPVANLDAFPRHLNTDDLRFFLGKEQLVADWHVQTICLIEKSSEIAIV
jgi:hypothetical protein